MKILFVEDMLSEAELIWCEIEKINISFSKLLVDNREDFLNGLDAFQPDIIISDFSLPLFDGMKALLIRNEKAPSIPFILVTGSMNEEVAVECMKAGADDYILKENLSRLGPAVINSINKIKLLKEKKTAEEELHKSELRLQKAQSIAHVGNWELDLSTKTLWCSEEAFRIYGLGNESNEILLKLAQKSVLPEYRPMLDETLDRLLKYNEPYEAEFKIIRINDGAIRSIHSKAEMVTARDSKQVKVIGVIQDITDRKENKEELIRAKEKAEESDRLKTAFLHNISHEIRTPLNAIVGFSIMLNEPDVDYKARQSYIEVIMQSSNHLLSIITDIVNISNIEANNVRILKKEINLNTTLRTLCDQFILKANEKKLSLTCETGLKHKDAFILTDSTKLIQIISNLINNALKFTNQGHINVGYRVKDDFLEFFVSDTGIGITPENHKKVFDRFFQVQDITSRVYDGTGLGLAISKAYVELLGGTIWLSSEPGKGTSLFFTIPYEKQIVKTTVVNENGVKDDFVFQVKKTILVAEDIESNFKLVKYFLSGSNADVIRAINGKEAVGKCLSEKNIDLVLMDIKMPVMDGYKAANLIRESMPDIPIIAMTAYADDMEKAIASGCAGYISKPFDKKGLLKVISEFI